jgi:probable rRNA maturation factor
MKPRPNQLNLAFRNEAKSPAAPKRSQFFLWIKHALTCDAEIAVRLVGSEEGQALNLTYRGKDYATNVLTFPLNDDPLMGDIVLCVPVVEAEAAAQNKSLEAHYAHLIIHGVLHLQGYDHESDEEAEAMEALEITLVTRLGYTNPYLIMETAT